MKIERKEAEFKPVVITLETQDEPDQLIGMVEHLSFKDRNIQEDLTYKLYENLRDMPTKKRYDQSDAHQSWELVEI